MAPNVPSAMYTTCLPERTALQEKLSGDRAALAARVCIVGAGVTGLCACKHLLQHGVESVVLEMQTGVGGVWRNTFSSTKLQTPRDAFQYSDFLWPPGTPRLPSHAQVLDYLESYARKFQVLERIVFNCRVLEVRRLDLEGPPPVSAFQKLPANAKWAVRVQQGSADLTQLDAEWLYFEYVLVCVGHYGDIAKTPKFAVPSKGPQAFHGKVLHSLDYSKLDEAATKKLLTGKRVIVVGSRKSALDAVMEASNSNRGPDGKPVTLLFRTPHWVIAHHFFYGIPMSYMTSRFSQLLVPQPGGGSTLHDIISAALSPLRWALSKALEFYLLSTLPLAEHGFVPNQNIFEEFKSCKLTLLPEHFFDYVKEGHIKLQKTSTWCFSSNGVTLPNGDELEADVIILCTGYEGERKIKSLLGTSFEDILQENDSSIPLYRGVLPPRIPNMAILGFQESYSNLFSAEMSARWVAYWIAGKIALPNKEIMEMEAYKWLRNTKPFMTINDKTCVNTTALQLADQMCRDMGWNSRRKKSLLQEIFAPYGNMDYKDE
uniref:Flavin-containing monooxygenase n=1 Tax=Pteridium aquilinum TaxID=32101 RepID=A0A7H1KPE2_PTEAQ|nr:fern oxime synthase 1 [Pteridium aquilinum]